MSVNRERSPLHVVCGFLTRLPAAVARERRRRAYGDVRLRGKPGSGRLWLDDIDGDQCRERMRVLGCVDSGPVVFQP